MWGCIAPPPQCGNTKIESGEDCDDGNVAGNDGCDPNCRHECGNTVINTGERCDDGNRNDFDQCSANCQADCSSLPIAACNDGCLTGSETCDRPGEEADPPQSCKNTWAPPITAHWRCTDLGNQGCHFQCVPN
jgi:cysteine-rich repeat protein